MDIGILLGVLKLCGWVQKGAGSHSVSAATDWAEVGVWTRVEATKVLAVSERDGIWFQIEVC